MERTATIVRILVPGDFPAICNVIEHRMGGASVGAGVECRESGASVGAGVDCREEGDGEPLEPTLPQWSAPP